MRAIPRFGLVIVRLITAILYLLRENTRSICNIGWIIRLRSRKPVKDVAFHPKEFRRENNSLPRRNYLTVNFSIPCIVIIPFIIL